MKQNKLICMILLIVSHYAYSLVGPVSPGQNLWCFSRDINLTSQTILDQLSTFSCNCAGSCNIIPLNQSNVTGGNLIISNSGHYCLQEDITLTAPSGAISLNANTIYLDLNNRTVNGNVIINGNFDTVIGGVILAPRATTVAIPNQAAVTINSTNSNISFCTIITTDGVFASGQQSRTGINNFGSQNQISNCIIQAGQGIFSTGINSIIVDCIITTSNGAGGGIGVAGNGGSGIILSNTNNTFVANCFIERTGNGIGEFLVVSNGGNGIWITNGSQNTHIVQNIISNTGQGGISGNLIGISGNGIQIDNTVISTEIINNIFSNTGTFTGTSQSTANMGGLAINDLTTSSTQTFIYGNFAYNIAQDTPGGIRYKIHNSVLEAGVPSPNPPTSSLINFMANVFTE